MPTAPVGGKSHLVFAGIYRQRSFPIAGELFQRAAKSDIDFMESFRYLWRSLSSDEPLLQSLFPGLGNSMDRDSDALSDPEPNQDPESAELPELALLSETDLHGLDYLRRYGFAVYSDTETKKDVQAEVESPAETAIETAVAQAFNANGEKLPSNVSYQYYELGLSQTALPVSGPITSGFEYRKNPLTGQREFHLALDIAALEGTEIAAFADGVVRYIGESDEFGLYFMIDHPNGVSTFYAHCSKLYVRKGDTVSCGQTVALVGRTGNVTGAHLHFTLLKDNIRLDPAHYVNP